MKNKEQYYYLSGEGRRFPAEDLYGYTDSLIIARLGAAYKFGCQLIREKERGVVADVGSGHGHQRNPARARNHRVAAQGARRGSHDRG